MHINYMHIFLAQFRYCGSALLMAGEMVVKFRMLAAFVRALHFLPICFQTEEDASKVCRPV
jgi:hypothetical protein